MQELIAQNERLRDQLPGLEPDRTVTDWGRSEWWSSLVEASVVRPLYHYWFRVESEGVENVPAAGGALLVANRSGRLPADGAMIVKAIQAEHPVPRSVHIASRRTFAGVPGIGMAITKLGGVGAHPANLHRLLFDERQLVLVFPEGARGVSKPLRARYQLRRFEGLAFVESAMRARVPIVPVAVLGAEEASPTLATLAPVPWGPRLPLTSVVPLPAKFRIRFLAPIATDQLGAAPWRDRRLTEDVVHTLQEQIQQTLLALVAARRSVWLG